MVNLFKKLDFKKRRPAKSRSPFLIIKKSKVNYSFVQLTGSKKLIIISRRFRTKKANRANSYKQFVFPVYLFGVKEVAISLQKTRKKRRSFILPKAFQPRKLLPLIVFIVGAAGTIYFGIQIRSTGELDPVTPFSLSTPAPVKAKAVKRDLPRSKPLHLSVPSVGINARVSEVGPKSH